MSIFCDRVTKNDLNETSNYMAEVIKEILFIPLHKFLPAARHLKMFVFTF